MITINGLDKLLIKLDKIIDQSELEQNMQRACLVVENSAKEKAPVGEGTLRRSITHRVEDDGHTGIVYTNLFYAPYVEYGTGVHAKNGDGRKGYWVYVKGSDGSAKLHERKEYTLEEAKQIMAILRAKGLEAFYTNGQSPKPFMEPALLENKEQILQILGGTDV